MRQAGNMRYARASQGIWAMGALFMTALLACEPTYLRPIVPVMCGPHPEGLQAAPASQWLDSLGFNMPLDEVFASGPDGKLPVEHLQALGVRHLRDSAFDEPHLDEMRAARLRGLGFKVLFQVSLTTQLDDLLPKTFGLAEAIQVPSPANDSFSYSITEVPGAAARLRQQLDAVAAGERPLLIGPIIFQEQDAAAVGNLGPALDYGGFRSGIGEVQPSRTYGQWVQMALGVSGGKPLLATKLSYNSRAGEPQAPGLTPDLHGKYVMRMLLESWNRGVIRTYYDHLYDGDCDEDLCKGGLIFADGRPKPAYESWKTLVEVLRANEGGAATSLERLPFTLAPMSEDVRATLLRRTDGAFVLILWLEVSGMNGRDVTQDVALSLGVPVADISSIDLRRPTAPPVRRDAETVHMLTISDAPLVLTIRAACR